MKKFVPLLMTALALLSPLQLFAQADYSNNFADWQITKTAGMNFFNPNQVFGREIGFKELPELSYINAQGTNEPSEQIRRLTQYLASNGIPLGLGVNPNRDSFFNLYGPSVDILLDEPAAQFGSTRESEVGKLHFITHDSTHLYFGIPGTRIRDLKG